MKSIMRYIRYPNSQSPGELYVYIRGPGYHSKWTEICGHPGVLSRKLNWQKRSLLLGNISPDCKVGKRNKGSN